MVANEDQAPRPGRSLCCEITEDLWPAWGQLACWELVSVEPFVIWGRWEYCLVSEAPVPGSADVTFLELK